MTTKSKKILLIIAVLTVLACGLYAWKTSSKNSDLKEREITVEKGDIELSILATGTVQPENRVEVKPPINGRVEQAFAEEGKKVKRGELLALMSSTERAALLDAARAKGAKELKEWEGLYPPTPILAPITGMLIQRNVESGQSFTSQDAIFVMSDRLTVKAQVDETDIAKIKLKQKVMITLDAYSANELPATVDQIAFDAKTVNNVTTYVVDVLPEQAPDYMRSGMTANVSFDIESRENVLVLPVDAILLKSDKKYVRVKQGSEIVEKTIETGLSDGKVTEIISGLKEGEIALAPQFKIKDGKGVKASPFAPTGRTRNRQ